MKDARDKQLRVGLEGVEMGGQKRDAVCLYPLILLDLLSHTYVLL